MHHIMKIWVTYATIIHRIDLDVRLVATFLFCFFASDFFSCDIVLHYLSVMTHFCKEAAHKEFCIKCTSFFLCRVSARKVTVCISPQTRTVILALHTSCEMQSHTYWIKNLVCIYLLIFFLLLNICIL